ncbi:MAG: 2'-5' RNA ligase family protein [Balneolaceae bacterium]|jgi:2'-5' RNA ligase
MTKTATYSLWLEPSGDIAFKLQERIKKLSSKYKTPVFSPHVTLLAGFKSTETELVSLANTLASTLEPFELLLTTAGYTDEFYRALFVHVEKTKHLNEMYMMARQLFDIRGDEDFMPHLSLMYGELSQNEKERILNIMGREFHIRFPVKNIVAMHTDGKPHEWDRVHTAVFKNH